MDKLTRMKMAAVFSLLPCIGLAAEWEELGFLDRSGSMIEIDASSIAPAESGFRKAWFKWTYTKPRPIDADLKNSKTYQQSLSLEYFDCKQRRSAQMQGIYRDSDGEVVSTFTISPTYRATWSEVAPETVGEVMFDRVCNPPPLAETSNTCTPHKIRNGECRVENEGS